MPSSRSIVIGVMAAALGGSLLSVMESGCGGDVDAAHYGPAGGLRNLVPRPSAGEGGAPPSGTTPPGGGNDSGPEGSTLCNGAGPIDGGTCAIKWSTDIYPKMQATGAWKCTDSNCHGSKNSGVTPPFDGTSSATAYAQLVAYTASNGKPYINPCSIDPTASSFVCNTINPPTGACGSLPMPSTAATPGAVALTTQEQADLLTWVKCGSPEN